MGILVYIGGPVIFVSILILRRKLVLLRELINNHETKLLPIFVPYLIP